MILPVCWFDSLIIWFFNLMPAAVLVCGSWFLMWFSGGCIFSSCAMHLSPNVYSCCESRILTVDVLLSLGCSLLGDIPPIKFCSKTLLTRKTRASGTLNFDTVKPDLKTTSIKRPPVLRDHFEILPIVNTIILTCIKRPPLFKDQRPLFCLKILLLRDHFFPQICILC